MPVPVPELVTFRAPVPLVLPEPVAFTPPVDVTAPEPVLVAEPVEPLPVPVPEVDVLFTVDGSVPSQRTMNDAVVTPGT